MRITTLTLAAGLALGLTGGALAQSTAAPGGTDRNLNNPDRMKGNAAKGMERTGDTPAGNPTQDTTGSIGHPKSTNSSGSPTAPAAR